MDSMEQIQMLVTRISTLMSLIQGTEKPSLESLIKVPVECFNVTHLVKVYNTK